MVIALGVGVFAATVGAQPASAGSVGQVADRGPRRARRGTRTRSRPSRCNHRPVARTGEAAGGRRLAGRDPRAGRRRPLPACTGCRPARATGLEPRHSRLSDHQRPDVRDRRQPRQRTSAAAPATGSSSGRATSPRSHPDAVVVDGRRLGRVRRRHARRLDPAHAGDPAVVDMYLRNATSAHSSTRCSATGAAVVAVKPPCYGESTLVGTDPQIAERRDSARLTAIDTAWTTAAREHDARVLDLDSAAVPRRRRRRRGAARRCPLRRHRRRQRGTRRRQGGPTGGRRRRVAECRRVIDDRRRRRGPDWISEVPGDRLRAEQTLAAARHERLDVNRSAK